MVPYRDREEHLQRFIPHMKRYLLYYPESIYIYIIEQSDDKDFNRGKLLNIGFLETKFLFYIFHDVDFLPLRCSYKGVKGITQMAQSNIQHSGYLGGVTMFNRDSFLLAEGYHNDYFHRAEDNEMMFNLKYKGIPVINRFGFFQQLPHERSGPEFIPVLWQKAQLPRTKNMLKTCEYQLISKELKDGYTHLRVLL